MIPKITLRDSIDNRKINGQYYYSNNCEDSEIVISKGSDNPSRTLIHEMIHHTLREMKQSQKYEKLAHRIFRREDFIDMLAVNLTKNLKFEFYNKDNEKVLG